MLEGACWNRKLTLSHSLLLLEWIMDNGTARGAYFNKGGGVGVRGLNYQQKQGGEP
jgi:hypothetical protein